MNNIYYYSVGKRKTSIAKLRLQHGVGKIIVNDQPHTVYFKGLGINSQIFKIPVIILNRLESFDAYIDVQGGGINSQLEAIELAIARVIYFMDKSMKFVLKKQRLLTRDSRIKERRKYGLKKARKAPQYSKR